MRCVGEGRCPVPLWVPFRYGAAGDERRSGPAATNVLCDQSRHRIPPADPLLEEALPVGAQPANAPARRYHKNQQTGGSHDGTGSGGLAQLVASVSL